MAVQVSKSTGGSVEEYRYDDSLDPLDFDTPESGLSLTPVRTLRGFTITTDSYISLCSRVYKACCTEISSFADHIPESVFQHYAVTLLWKRFAEILPSSVTCGSQFFKELRQLCDDIPFYAPAPLQTYLKGIGHFCDPYNCERQFMLPVIPSCEKIAGIPYTFGKVNAKTHSFYEAFPAPGIAALRVMADITYAKNPCKENLFWDLPRDLQPDPVESHIESNKPTKNLLGWAPAQPLTDNQQRLFETSKIDASFMQNDYSSLENSIKGLYGTIQKYLSNKSRCGIKSWSTSLYSLTSRGSLVQGIAIERHEFSNFDRSAMYCEGTISACSPYRLNDKLTKGAVIAGYRMAKEQIRNRHCWSCYDFNEYLHVPESWIRSRNTIYMYGSPGTLNEKLYATACIAKSVLQNECIFYALKPMQKWNIYV